MFGIIPNFYVVYEPNPAPLTTKLKFQLALKTSSDAATILGVGVLAGINQAGDTPDYVQGAKGYAQRLWRSRCRRLFRHHDRWRHPALVAAPRSPLLLPGDRLK